MLIHIGLLNIIVKKNSTALRHSPVLANFELQRLLEPDHVRDNQAVTS
ncbi:hypothetical protein NTGBS_400018 [Candidatus Nitrotoga sp. BS]|nr:hypothetical protein NTGBS_400018 [Candidatus Nitrotoga sp. BS]